jgi:murein L,D-transpeptidase YcbB/YkuD
MKWTSGVFLFVLMALGVIFSKCGGGGNAIDTVATPIAATVDKIKIAEKYYNDRVQLKTQIFYRANENKRTWLNKGRPNDLYKAFIKEVKESPRYGFHVEDYRIDSLQKDVEALYDNRKRTEDDLSKLDIRITSVFFLFTTHLLEGRVRYPGAREFFWEKGMPLENDIAMLIKMESGADLRKEIAALHPRDPQYVKMQEAYQ